MSAPEEKLIPILVGDIPFPIYVKSLESVRVENVRHGDSFESTLYDGDLILVKLVNQVITWEDASWMEKL